MRSTGAHAPRPGPRTRDGVREIGPDGTAQELRGLAESLVEGALRGRAEGAGAVAAGIIRAGETPVLAVAGRTVTFGADGALLPDDVAPSRPVTIRTPFDLASVTKVVTTLVAAAFLDEGALELDRRAVDVLGPGSVPDRRITVRHLLTHTSGLPPVLPLWRGERTRRERLDAIGKADLIAEPGTRHAYSCIGFITLGRMLEAIGGASLPDLARDRVLIPAGAHGATWCPDATARDHAAATEIMDDPPRGLVRGEVHDETAWSIGGAGNAGLFASLEDVLALAAVLAGTAAGPAISARTRDLLSTDQLPAGVTTGSPWHQGLGLRIGQELPDGGMLPHVIGHTGFTGTALWADPRTGSVAVLLTNRVHPRRDRFDVTRARQEVARLAFA